MNASPTNEIYVQEQDVYALTSGAEKELRGSDTSLSAPELELLVLLDVMMPDMDGPTVLKRLREQSDTSAIPVVFLTARSQGEEIRQLRALGALDVICKPFDPMTLAQTVKSIWDDSLRG